MHVKRAVGRFLELGMAAYRSRTGRPTTAVTSKNLNKLRRRNSERLIPEIAKDLNINRKRVQLIVTTKPKKGSYKLCCLNHLTEAMKAKQLLNTRKIRPCRRWSSA